MGLSSTKARESEYSERTKKRLKEYPKLYRLRETSYHFIPVLEQYDVVVQPDDEEFELVQVIQIARHGDRTPLRKRLGWLMDGGKDDLEDWGRTVMKSSDVEAVEGLHPRSFNIPYEDRVAVPFGELTELGAAYIREYGEFYRALYVDFYGLLPDFLNASVADQFYVRSTNKR